MYKGPTFLGTMIESFLVNNILHITVTVGFRLEEQELGQYVTQITWNVTFYDVRHIVPFSEMWRTISRFSTKKINRRMINV